MAFEGLWVRRLHTLSGLPVLSCLHSKKASPRVPHGTLPVFQFLPLGLLFGTTEKSLAPTSYQDTLHAEPTDIDKILSWSSLLQAK